MRYSTALLPLAATVSAVVIPDEATAKQLVLEAEQQAEKTVSSWWDILPSVNGLLSSAESTLDKARDAVEQQADKLSDLLPKFDVEISDFLSPSYYISNGDGDGDTSTSLHHVHGTNLTVYQSIHASNYSKKFAALVDDFPDLVDKLNATDSGNVTVFVPTDKAFAKIPDHHKGKGKKPPKEFVEKILQYHVLPGFYPAGRVLAHHTLPTALEEAELGGRPQRLRVSVGLFGVKLNFYSKIVFANLFTKNGILHGVDSILLPPPPAEKLISLFPTKFSTLELAAEKTGFTHHKSPSSSDESLTGLTIFAPTNLAFKKLGPGANAFLFNTDKGLHFLKALLAYHVVANETLYSDAYYGKKSSSSSSSSSYFINEEDDEVDADIKPVKHYHVDLPTLLGDKHIAVDVSRWYGFIKIRLNGRVDVAVQDGLAKDGVVQVVDSVLFPPHPHKGAWADGEISVDELIERLSPFVRGEEEEKESEVGEL
ncbi:FAS1 domain-containing protein [Hypoxylon crocopeplum]|nr:FAS1 domain-containing protein [Hypoxylon crocopeplum]